MRLRAFAAGAAFWVRGRHRDWSCGSRFLGLFVFDEILTRLCGVLRQTHRNAIRQRRSMAVISRDISCLSRSSEVRSVRACSYSVRAAGRRCRSSGADSSVVRRPSPPRAPGFDLRITRQKHEEVFRAGLRTRADNERQRGEAALDIGLQHGAVLGDDRDTTVFPATTRTPSARRCRFAAGRDNIWRRWLPRSTARP